MNMTRTIGITVIVGVGLVLLFQNLEARNMSHIKLDLGRNIMDTARDSGVPKYSTRNVAGLVSYGVDDLPDSLTVAYTRAGFEVEFTSAFALTLYADEAHRNNLAVSYAALQFSTRTVRDHVAGQQFVRSINSKFSKKNWTRHIPELCPAVSGQSSFMTPDGTFAVFEGCPLDPNFEVKADDWRSLSNLGLSYEWFGDGIIATVSVNSSEDVRGITYLVTLEFEDESTRSKHRSKMLAKELAEGDRQGWNSTTKHETSMRVLKEEIKAIEANAVKRGDQLVSRERK